MILAIFTRGQCIMPAAPAKPATTPSPVPLSASECKACILPPLAMPQRGPQCKLGSHRVFNLLLWVLYTGMPWKGLPSPQDAQGKPAIPSTTVYKVCARWSDDDALEHAFSARVRHLAQHHQRDLSILHGDGPNTVATKGGDGSVYCGHQHQQGDKVIALIDNNGSVLAPLPVALVNAAETGLVPEGLKALKRVAKLTGLALKGAYCNWDGGCASKAKRQASFHAGRIPNITEKPRNRRTPKRGRKRWFNPAMHGYGSASNARLRGRPSASGGGCVLRTSNGGIMG